MGIFKTRCRKNPVGEGIFLGMGHKIGQKKDQPEERGKRLWQEEGEGDQVWAKKKTSNALSCKAQEKIVANSAAKAKQAKYEKKKTDA